VAGVSVLAREALRSRAAGLLAPAAFLTFASFLKLATGGPREKTLMVLCLEVALLMLLRRRWFWGGFFTALATLTWQPALLPVVVAAVVATLTTRSARLRVGAAYIGGGLVPTVLLTGYFVAEGALRVAVWGFVLVNLGYTDQPSIIDSWGLVTDDYGWSLVLVGIGAAGALLLAVTSAVRLRRAGGPDEVGRGLLVLGSGALTAILWSCFALNGGADLFVVLPFAAIGVAALLVELGAKVRPTPARRLVAAGVAVAVALACIEAVTTQDHRLPAERRDVTRMVAALPDGSTVLSLSAPEVPVLAHRRNPYPWQLSNGAISAFLDDHLAGGLAAYADRVSRLDPALIAIGNRTADDWLLPVLDRQYTRVGSGGHFVWYAANSLGPAMLHHLRAVNRHSRKTG
jgi:hypothetical protein